MALVFAVTHLYNVNFVFNETFWEHSFDNHVNGALLAHHVGQGSMFLISENICDCNYVGKGMWEIVSLKYNENDRQLCHVCVFLYMWNSVCVYWYACVTVWTCLHV